MKYLQSTPFSSPPANDAFKKNYPFAPTRFERELAEEKAVAQTEAETGLAPGCKLKPEFGDLPAGERVDQSFALYCHLAELATVRSLSRAEVGQMNACVLQYAMAIADIREANVRKSSKG